MRGSTKACLALSVLAAWGTATGVVGAQPQPERAPESTPPSEQPLTPPPAVQPPPPLEATPPAAAPPPAPAPTYAPQPSPSPPYAAPPPTAPYAPPPAAAAPAAPPAEDRARVADAHADRVLLLPTAYTHPEGTVYLSSYEIVLLQAGYAFTDTTQLTLTATPPLGEDAIFPLDLSLKQVVVRDGPVRAALIGSITGVMGFPEGNFVLGRIGGVVQLCFDDDCESSASMATTALLAGPVTVAITGAGVTWRVANWLAVLAEFGTLVPFGREAGEANGAAMDLGVRFPFRRVAVDLGLIGPVGRGANLVPALPWIAVTYRFL